MRHGARTSAHYGQSAKMVMRCTRARALLRHIAGSCTVRWSFSWCLAMTGENALVRRESVVLRPSTRTTGYRTLSWCDYRLGGKTPRPPAHPPAGGVKITLTQINRPYGSLRTGQKIGTPPPLFEAHRYKPLTGERFRKDLAIRSDPQNGPPGGLFRPLRLGPVGSPTSCES